MRKVRVSRRRLRLGVPEHFPKHRQAFATRNRERSKRMPQVMDANIV
jgi:hypothetical protein